MRHTLKSKKTAVSNFANKSKGQLMFFFVISGGSVKFICIDKFNDPIKYFSTAHRTLKLFYQVSNQTTYKIHNYLLHLFIPRYEVNFQKHISYQNTF